jgi:hypothetical protein
LNYCNLSPEPFDFLGAIVSSMEIAVKTCEPNSLEPNDAVLVNCIGCPPHRVMARIDPRRAEETMLMVTDSAQAETFSRLGSVLSLPASYGALRAACGKIARRSENGTRVGTAWRR